MALMQFSRKISCQSSSCSLIIGSYRGLTLLQALQILSHLPQLASNHNYFWPPHISQNNFSLSSLLPPSMLLGVHWIAISMFTSLMIPVAEEFSLMYASTYLTSFFLYLTLKFWTIPASSGWSLEVVFLIRKMIFICENESTTDFEWHVALFMNKSTFLSSNSSFLLNRFSTASITSGVIHDIGLEK